MSDEETRDIEPEDDEEDDVFMDEAGEPFTPITTWKTKEGVIIPVPRIDDFHLKNIIRVLERQGNVETPAYKTMVWEQKRRRSGHGLPVPILPVDLHKLVSSYDLKTRYPAMIPSMTVDPVSRRVVPEPVKIETEKEEQIIVQDVVVQIVVGEDPNAVMIKDMLADGENNTMQDIFKKASDLKVKIEIPSNGAFARFIDEIVDARNERDEIFKAFDDMDVGSEAFAESIAKLKKGDDSGSVTILKVMTFLESMESRRN